MGATYTIQEVVSSETFGDEANPMVANEVRLNGPTDGRFDPVSHTVKLYAATYWDKKDGTRELNDQPKAGDELYGHVEEAGGQRGGFKFKRESQKNRERTPVDGPQMVAAQQADDKKQASIVRQHSQDMALQLIVASSDAHELDLSNKELVGNYLNNVVKPITDWFVKDAGGKDEQLSATPTTGPAEQTPEPELAAPPVADPTADKYGGDDDIPFAYPRKRNLETRNRDLFVGDRWVA